MVPYLTGTEHAVGPDLAPFGGDDGAAVQPGVAPDVDDGPGAGGDQTVDLGVRPGVDISLEFHSPGTGDPKPAISQQARCEVDVAAHPVRQRCHPAAGARGDLLPFPALSLFAPTSHHNTT